MIIKPRALAYALAVTVLLAVPYQATAATSPPEPTEPPQVQSVPGGAADLNLVLVFDGLRPDSINAEDTPNLYRLREEGVNFTNSHAVVPTVTRVNAASLSTGTYPGTHGIVGNSMYIPEVDPTNAFSTGDANNLIELREKTGEVVLVDTLAERLGQRDKRVVSIGSGSSGSSYLLNPDASEGSGVMINTGDPDGTTPFAFPTEVGDDILERFGPPPTKEGVENSNASVDYMTTVFNEYVLSELRPDVATLWFTEPDGTQHATGAGSPESLEVIRNDDRNVGLILDRLNDLGLADDTNIFLTSDHGFSLTTAGINVAQDLIDAGLKASKDSDDVVVANTGASLIHVKDRDPRHIRKIVEYLQEQPYADALYTAAKRPVHGKYKPVRDDADAADIADGWVDGTFSLELVHEANPQRGADILLTFPWTSETNTFGVPGTATTSTGGESGPRTGPGSGHGSFSPWDVRNTLIAWGTDFKDGVNSPVPAGNVDIAPTILALEGVDDTALVALDGRKLTEALNEGPDPLKVPYQTRTFVTEAADGAYRTAVQISEADGTRYVDKSWRQP